MLNRKEKGGSHLPLERQQLTDKLNTSRSFRLLLGPRNQVSVQQVYLDDSEQIHSRFTP